MIVPPNCVWNMRNIVIKYRSYVCEQQLQLCIYLDKHAIAFSVHCVTMSVFLFVNYIVVIMLLLLVLNMYVFKIIFLLLL